MGAKRGNNRGRAMSGQSGLLLAYRLGQTASVAPFYYT
jgi:hypothetical protein